MGCSASSLETLIAKAIEDPSTSSTNSSTASSNISSLSCISVPNSSSSSSIDPKTRSFATPLVHHPALEKGDSHHLVCLTSSTYGSLVLGDDNNNDDNFCCVENDEFSSGKSSPDSVINTWELMEGLEDDDIGCNVYNNVVSGILKNGQRLPSSKLIDPGSDFRVKYSNLCDFNNVQKIPSSKLVDSGSDFMLKSSGFCDFKNAQKLPGSKLVDYGCDFKVKTSNLCDFKDAQKVNESRIGSNLSDSLMKLNDSYVFVEMPDELNPNSKPLWKHLSEESLLSKMDLNVCNAYDKALLAKKLGFSKSGKVSKSVGSSPFVSKSKSIGLTTPVTSKISSGDSNSIPKCEDKIVLYFTSLRGIRKTYEDCSSVRMILRGFRVVVDERDISMDSSYRKELERALVGKPVSLPQLFIRGKLIGGADDVMLLHETGELERILEGCLKKECGSVCQGCGDARFVPCLNCNGSRKVFQEEEGRTRRCSNCNENGLVRCPGCCS